MLATIAMAAACSPAAASQRTYGRQLVKSPRWGNDLEDLVNSPLRVEGTSSSCGASFHFDGNNDQINQLIAIYARTEAPRVQLTVEESSAYSLSLEIWNHGSGESVLTVHVQNLGMLAGLRIPRGVPLEAVRTDENPLDETLPAAMSMLWGRVLEFVARTPRG